MRAVSPYLQAKVPVCSAGYAIRIDVPMHYNHIYCSCKGDKGALLKKLVIFRTFIGYDVIDIAIQDAAEVIERRGA